MKRSPLRRGTSTLTRTPLARIGRKKRNKAAARSYCRDIVQLRDKNECQFKYFVMQAIIDRHVTSAELADEATGVTPCWGPLDVHELVARSVWPDGDLEPENCVLLCRAHHSWLDDNRLVAEALRLYQRVRPQ